MKLEANPSPDRAVLIEIGEDSDQQRLDNFLLKVCKGVPKSHIFRIIRSGEVRINKSRASASSKLVAGDLVRIPPIRTASREVIDNNKAIENRALNANIQVVYEDEVLLAVNKPSGLAVHGGSGVSLGVIETLRLQRQGKDHFLELVHRIDRETSGLLLVAKKRSALRTLQEQLRTRSWKKYYFALVQGAWNKSLQRIDLPLLKVQASEKEQKVYVDPKGDPSSTLIKTESSYKFQGRDLTLIRAQILTGRTHQIRVHTSASGHPIVGDDRYGDFDFNKALSKSGLKRMFLHASRVILEHPRTGETLQLEAPLADELTSFLKTLEKSK